jgi:hypothetical protein
MIALPRRLLILAGIAVLLLTSVNLWLEPNFELQFSPTSFGIGPSGYKAAFDLAGELGISVTRSYIDVKRQPPPRQLLMVSPSLLEKESSGDAPARDLLRWVRSGGTAIVFGGAGSEWDRLGISVPTYAGTDHDAISGDFAPTMRRIAVPGLLHFEAAPKDAQVRLRAEGSPFAIERKVGKGSLIAIADDRFLRNVNLGNSDNSLLFIDLVHRFDKVVFDEHCHGMVADISLYSAVLGSRAILPICVGLMLEIVWVLAQHTWPRRLSVETRALASLSIEPFVESLGVLYSRASDPKAVFRAYRDGFLRRLRQQMMPFGSIEEGVILQRISRDRSLSDETRRWLTGPSAPKNNAELLQAVRAIEAYAGSTNG